MDLEVRHLRTVVAVATHGSVTKAAAALGLAQPALSAQLARIERALGGPVFVREPRGVRPTPLGRLVLDRAATLLPAMDALHHDARRTATSGADPRELRLAVVGTALVAALARVLHDDDRRVALRSRWCAQDGADDVAGGAADALVAGMCADALPPVAPGVQWQRVGTDPLHALVAAGRPVAPDGTVDLAELADADWVAHPADDCGARCFAAACARAGFTPRSRGECEPAVALDLVRAGLAVALAPAAATHGRGVRALRIEGDPVRRATWVAWHASTPADVREAVLHAAREARRRPEVGTPRAV
ncbi:LysR family transcriptional regulator [Cellulomonas oligotrophica]|nr:LysR family transcriptional regulator [Cellulomonas oligotrophica]NYD85825.1 DNA-binding transcriptional LysR family regulator [Cellulomonas oligotrophica]